ncbi:MAG: MM0924 family protein [Acidobacteriota bacterium]
MEELIRRMTGKKIDVSCGSGAMLRGEVVEVRDGVLFLRDEDEKSAYVAIDKIATVYECADAVSRPGFIG